MPQTITRSLLLAAGLLLVGARGVTAQTGQTGDCAELKTQLDRAESRLRDWPQLNRYREANSSLAPPARNEARVVFMGDSITDLWDDQGYGGFFPGKPYVNRGISGQTTPQMLL